MDYHTDKEAYKKLNEIIMETLEQQLSRKSSKNLEGLLRQTAETYKEKHQWLCWDTDSWSDDDGDVDIDHHTLVRRRCHAFESVRIVRPLDKVVRRLLDVKPRSDPPSEADEYLLIGSRLKLNELIGESVVLWEAGGHPVLQLSDKVFVQAGLRLDCAIYDQLVHMKRYSPRLQTPKVLGALQAKETVYWFFSKMQGTTLDKSWPSMSEEQKEDVQNQLVSFFRKLRRIPAPPAEDAQSNIGGGNPRRCKDLRNKMHVAVNPIKDEKEFNDFLISAVGVEVPHSFRGQLYSRLRNDHPIVLTHGQLHPENIMVRWTVPPELSETFETYDMEFTLTGILDWEMSGWYPAYWEYVTAFRKGHTLDRMVDWCTYLPTKAIGSWVEEHGFDLVMSRLMECSRPDPDSDSGSESDESESESEPASEPGIEEADSGSESQSSEVTLQDSDNENL